MHLIIFFIVVIAVIAGPGWWVKRTLKKYSEPADRYSGTGGELARHLLDKLNLQHVDVEPTDQGDHYDPTSKTVRLGPEHFNSKSLSAITVAAHEVGHAIQHADGYQPLLLRTKLAPAAASMGKLAGIAFVAAPLVGLLTRNPGATGLVLMLAAIGVFAATILHLITLPVEWDASFGRALPVLDKAGVLLEGDKKHATRILRAAAFTYVSQALMSLAYAWRWLR